MKKYRVRFRIDEGSPDSHIIETHYEYAAAREFAEWAWKNLDMWQFGGGVWSSESSPDNDILVTDEAGKCTAFIATVETKYSFYVREK